MKTKQIISIALMLALLVTASSGCGTKETASPNNKEESTSVISSVYAQSWVPVWHQD